MTTFRRLPFLLLATAASAQLPPPGGFPVLEQLDVPITYSDGYQTQLDMRWPAAVAPAAGWPVLMVVHGGGNNRKVGWVQSLATKGAARGYVTLAYDTGNQGITTVLNPPGLRLDDRRITDLAEVFYLAELLLGAVMDDTCLGIMGKSGGGKHALWGASFSGGPLPIAGYVTDMPVITAIHTDIQVIDTVSDALPQAAMFKAEWVRSTFEREGLTGPLSTMILAHDYAGLATVLQADPTLNLLPALQQTDVALLVSYAYDDSKHFVNVNADALQTLLPTTPTRYLQITGGHGAVVNTIEKNLREDFTLRWCDRFLRGIPNLVDVEPFAEIAVLPSAPAEYLDFQSQWRHRMVDAWPNTGTHRLHLRGNGSLTAAAPTGAEPGPTIEHRVAVGYDLVQFVIDDINPQNVLPSIPLVTRPFDTAPLTAPAELLGRSVVELDLVSTGPDFQLQAALLDVPPIGPPRFITAGVSALRGAGAGRHHLRIELGDVGYVLEAGHRLRVSLENMNLHRQPGNAHFYVAPDFDDVDLTVQIDTTFAPFVDLPLRPAATSLVPRFAATSVSGGWQHTQTIEGEASRAGGVYQMLLSASGTVPGIAWGPLRLPLHPDAFSTLSLSLTNTAFLPQWGGVLDADGRAVATMNVPAVIALILGGLRFSMAAYGIDALGAPFVTPWAELQLDP